MPDVPDIHDGVPLEAWLAGQTTQSAVAIAVRAALRVAPLARSRDTRHFAAVISAIFRANALARVVAKYPTLTNSFGFSKPAVAAKSADTAAAAAAREAARIDTSPAARAAASAADAARAAEAAFVTTYAEDSAFDAAGDATVAATHAYVAAYNAYVATGVDHTTAAEQATIMWAAVRADAATISGDNASAVADMPLWQSGAPIWAANAWSAFKAALPRGQDWDVWIDWYEERLRGGSRGKEYELVFANVPQEEWEKGPAAANGWIKANLPMAPTTREGEAAPQIRSQVALREWLEGQSTQTSVAIAVRSALRVLPLTIRQTQFQSGTTAAHQLAVLAGLMFRWTARALGTARYRAIQPDSDQIAIEVSAGPAARAAAHAAASASQDNLGDPRGAAAHAGYSAEAAAEAVFAADESLAAWVEVNFDIAIATALGAARLAEKPLWSGNPPPWASEAWVDFQAALPVGGWECLDRLVRATPARGVARRGVRTGLRPRSAGGMGQGTGGRERVGQGASSIAQGR
jgi:hypothetical protein